MLEDNVAAVAATAGHEFDRSADYRSGVNLRVD